MYTNANTLYTEVIGAIGPKGISGTQGCVGPVGTPGVRGYTREELEEIKHKKIMKERSLKIEKIREKMWISIHQHILETEK